MGSLTHVGIGIGEVTPQRAVFMDGYAMRSERSAGVHDALHARCFLFRDDSTPPASAAIVILDVLGVSSEWASVLRDVVAGETDVPPRNVIVAGTHTHAGPAGPASEKPSPCAPEDVRLLDGVRTAARSAAASLAPAAIGFGSACGIGIAGHRTHPDRAVDDSLWVMRVDDLGGRLRGVLANYPCHSTVLSPENLCLSGDLLGAAAARAEIEARSAATVAVSYGAAGDLSTRFSRCEQSFEELDRLSRILAAAMLQLVDRVKTIRSAALRVIERSCRLPHRDVPSEAAVRAEIERAEDQLSRTESAGSSPEFRILKTRHEGLKALERLIAGGAFSQVGTTVSLSGVGVGAGRLISIPGEPFNAVLRQLRAIVRPPATLALLACANGYEGYFPDRDAVEGGWYEAQISRFDHRALDELAGAATDILRRLEGAPCDGRSQAD